LALTELQTDIDSFDICAVHSHILALVNPYRLPLGNLYLWENWGMALNNSRNDKSGEWGN